MVMLKNPLTTEERLAITRVLDHDMTNILNNIYSGASIRKRDNSTKLTANLNTFANFYRTLRTLIQEDIVGMWSNCNQDKTERFAEDISENSRTIDCRFCLELQSQYSEIPMREQDFTQSVLHNLVKNSVYAGAKLVRINIEPSGFPETATFIPEGARDYKDFIAFRVSDNGCGFPQGEDLNKRFTVCPPKREHGFGLYFTGLVAKVLRAPVEIKSVPGDTTVSFYHPVYEVTN